jgi:sorting nexin-29
VRQGDALSSILFDLVLEAILQKMNITGYIGTKSTQIFAYADDVAILSRNKNALKDTVINTESEARRRGLLINENKTKHMEVTRTVVNGEHLRCGKRESEHVKEFSYLGSQVNQTNPISGEMQARILSGNRCYHAYGKLMKSRALNRSSKLQIYRSLIRPVVTYGCEAWTLTNRDEQNLRISERRILRKIFGPVQNGNGSWRIRMHYEPSELIKNADIVKFIKSRRMAWLCHVMRTDEKNTSENIRVETNR